MNGHAFSEDQLVEQPAIGLFGTLGWQTVSAKDEVFGPDGTLGRETKGEVVLAKRLRAALYKFNPSLPSEAIQTAIDELTRDRSAMMLEAANREVYGLLKEGITVSVPDREHGGQKTERLRVVDWEHPENNDFLLVSQFSVTGALYTCRPDLVGFVNGLPWVVIELKKPGVPARAAFDENLTHYKQQIPALYWSNALIIASNGTDSRVGSLTAEWGRWVEWKRIEREDEARRVSLEVMLRGTCDRTRLLDLVENFTLFYENRTPELQLVNPDLNEDIYKLIEDADLDADQEAKLEWVLGRQYHLITRDDRLETVALDIVRHFLGRGFVGKAMVSTLYRAVKPDPSALEFASRVACLSTLADRFKSSRRKKDLPADDLSPEEIHK